MKGRAQGAVEAEAGWGGCGVSEPVAGPLVGGGFPSSVAFQDVLESLNPVD